MPWTSDNLDHIGAAEELQLASRRAKYDRYGPNIVGSVVGLDAAVTICLLPNTDTDAS